MGSLKAIYQWVIRTMMKSKGETGIVKTLPNKDLVELNTQITAQRLMQNGIDPTQLKNADQVENVINQIERSNTQVISQGDPRFQGIMDQLMGGKKSAKVFDMEGKEIPKGSKIMGGKQAETDAEIKARLDKSNKEGIARIKNKNMVRDAIDNASPGFVSGDRKYNAQLVAEDLAERMGLVYDDLPIREQTKLYGEAFDALSKMRFEARQTPKGSKIMGGKEVKETGIEGLKQKMAKEKARTQRTSGSLRSENNNRIEIGEPKLDEDEYEYYREILGEDADYEYYPVKGDETREFLEAMVKESEDEMAYIKRLYDRGALDPKPGEKGRKKFLDRKAQKGDKMSQEEIEELNKLSEEPEDFAQGGRAGFKSGSFLFEGAKKLGKKYKGSTLEALLENPKLLGTELSYEGIMELLRMGGMMQDGGRIGLKIGTGLNFLQKVFGKDRFEEIRKTDPEMYQGLLEVVDMYRKRDKEGLKMYLQKFLPHMDDAQIEDFIRGSDGLAGELTRLGSGRDYAGKLEMMKKLENAQKLKNLEVTDDMIRKPNADGGIMRLGFKDGMTRRTFLKILGGAMAIPIVGKFFKLAKVGKTVTKVPMIKTDNVPGKPEWFDALVNKVITDGDDVTKKFATGERQSIHQKTLDDGSVVRVTEDIDDGAVRVEYQSEKNVFGDDVLMQYKKPLPDEGAPSPRAEFTTAESGPVGRQTGPDDFDIEVDEVGGTSIRDLDSDVSKLKEYATGQKPTMRELVQNIKRKDKAKAITEGGDEMIDAVTRRQVDYVPEPEDFASGGIARMLGE